MCLRSTVPPRTTCPLDWIRLSRGGPGRSEDDAPTHRAADELVESHAAKSGEERVFRQALSLASARGCQRRSRATGAPCRFPWQQPRRPEPEHRSLCLNAIARLRVAQRSAALPLIVQPSSERHAERSGWGSSLRRGAAVRTSALVPRPTRASDGRLGRRSRPGDRAVGLDGAARGRPTPESARRRRFCR
jgi:hypothetical protein